MYQTRKEGGLLRLQTPGNARVGPVEYVATRNDLRVHLKCCASRVFQQGMRRGAVYYAYRIQPRKLMASSHIVVHYHELWLKQGNRRFFLHKLREALRRALEGIRVLRISQPADRLIIELADSAAVEEALQRLARVSGISHLGVARVLRRSELGADPLPALCAAAWEEVQRESFASFAVRARRSDKKFPLP